MARIVSIVRCADESSDSTPKVALSTAGTSGTDAATARRMAELGTKVVITGRRQREGWRLISPRRDSSALLNLVR